MGKRRVKTSEQKETAREWNVQRAGTGRPHRGIRRWDQKREKEGVRKIEGELNGRLTRSV